MRAHWQRFRAAAVFAFVGSVGSFGLTGCGKVGPPEVYQVKGRVVLSGADAKRLAGGHVEAALVNDLSVQASGEIQEDGTFTLATIHDGKPLNGAQAGEYKARIILTDEDSGNRYRKGVTVAPRFAQYATSGLTFQVPVASDVQLAVSGK